MRNRSLPITIRAACSIAQVRVGIVKAARNCYQVRVFEPQRTYVGSIVSRRPKAFETLYRNRVRVALVQLGWSREEARRAGEAYTTASGIDWKQAVAEQVERYALADPTADGSRVLSSAVRSAPSQTSNTGE